jgi:hypothetical protein
MTCVAKVAAMFCSIGSILDLGSAWSRRSMVAAQVAPGSGCLNAIREAEFPGIKALRPPANKGQSARISMLLMVGILLLDQRRSVAQLRPRLQHTAARSTLACSLIDRGTVGACCPPEAPAEEAQRVASRRVMWISPRSALSSVDSHEAFCLARNSCPHSTACGKESVQDFRLKSSAKRARLSELYDPAC